MPGISIVSASKTTTGSSASYSASGWLRQERATLSTTPAASSSYVWTLTNPNGSSSAKAYLSDATASSPNFVPDVGGTYVVACKVDGTTDYSVQMTVLSTAASEPVEALRMTPRADAQVAAPSVGKAVFYSSDEGDLATKDSSGTVRTILQGAASGAEYGEMYWSTPAATTIAADTWTKAAGTTTLGMSNEFSMPTNNRLRHDDTDTEVYHVTFDCTVTAGGNNKTAWIGISKNGAEPSTSSQRYRLISTGADAGSMSTQGLFSLASSDYVELWVKTTDGTSLTIQRAAMVAMKVL